MSFAKGNQSPEEFKRTLYKGVASASILAVNPTKSELEKIYGTTIDKEPEYLGEFDDNGRKIKTVRICFIVKVEENKYKNADGTPVKLITQHNFFLRNMAYVGSKSGKKQIIDAYGNTAWATPEEVEAKSIPQYKNGPANIADNYRLAWVGEEDLTNFLIKFLNIPSCFKWNNGNMTGWVDNLDDCQARLENISNYFKGDVSEIKECIKLQPENTVKIAFGVKTANDGRMFQTTYTKMCFSNSVTNYSRLTKELKESQSELPDFTGDNNVSVVSDLTEYVVTPTNFAEKKPETTSSPFDTPDDDCPFGN